MHHRDLIVRHSHSRDPGSRLLRIAAAKTILRDAAPPLARLPPRYLEAVLRLRSLPRVQRAPKPVGSRQVRFAVRVVQRRNHPRLVRAPSAGPSYSFRRGIASGTSRTRSSTRRCASASLTCCSGWYARKSRLRRDSASSASGVLAPLPRSSMSARPPTLRARTQVYATLRRWAPQTHATLESGDYGTPIVWCGSRITALQLVIRSCACKDCRWNRPCAPGTVHRARHIC